MSKRLYIRILQPLEGFQKNKIYEESEIDGLEAYYGDVADGTYFRTLEVRSTYASIQDIAKYASDKYRLKENKNYAFSFYYNGDVQLSVNNKQHLITWKEREALQKPHVDRRTYCKTYKGFDIDIRMSDVLSQLVPDGISFINDKLIQEALKLFAEELCEDDQESLESYFDYDPQYEGKLLASMLVAQKIAECVGGAAVLEYD